MKQDGVEEGQCLAYFRDAPKGGYSMSSNEPEKIGEIIPRVVNKPTYREVAQMAIDVQNAANLSGVAHSFVDTVLPVLREEMDRRGTGNTWRDQHPIVRLFLGKLADMAGINHSLPYRLAEDMCRRIAAGQEGVY